MEGEFLPIKEGKRGTMYHKIDDDAWFIMNHKSSKPALKRDMVFKKYVSIYGFQHFSHKRFDEI